MLRNFNGILRRGRLVLVFAEFESNIKYNVHTSFCRKIMSIAMLTVKKRMQLM